MCGEIGNPTTYDGGTGLGDWRIVDGGGCPVRSLPSIRRFTLSSAHLVSFWSIAVGVSTFWTVSHAEIQSYITFPLTRFGQSDIGIRQKMPMTLAQIEKRAIKRALLRARGNVSVAAKELDVSRQTLYNRAADYGWLGSDGRIDPNLVEDGRRSREYWKPSPFRDTPTNRKLRAKRARAYTDAVSTTGRDMAPVRHGNSDERAWEAITGD